MMADNRRLDGLVTGFLRHDVAARRRKDLRALRAQDADVADDNLAADAELTRELCARQRLLGLPEALHQDFAPFLRIHGLPPALLNKKSYLAAAMLRNGGR